MAVDLNKKVPDLHLKTVDLRLKFATIGIRLFSLVQSFRRKKYIYNMQVGR